MSRQLTILLTGMIAAHPNQGGATWAVLQYALGLERLGHEVVFVEPVNELRPDSAAYFDQIVSGFDLRAVLLRPGQPCPFVRDADVLINISGMLRDAALETIPIRIYLDLDPVFNQLWSMQGIDVGFEGHTHYVTVGTQVPDCGLEWIPTLPPVVLEHWPVAERIRHGALTTVANWRGYGSIEHNGVRYGQKAHSLRHFLLLPRASGERFELALNIDPAETRDLEALAEHGWHLLDPRAVARTPSLYAEFVRGSRAEFGIAKEGYVVSRSGWFSDRSACYLASGRPVVAQDTGFGDSLPTGAGLLAFNTIDDAVAATEELRRDYGRHARAARAIAEEFLDSDRVLRRLLREVGVISSTASRGSQEATDAELADLVGGAVLRRRPFAYRSSAPIIEIDTRLPNGATVAILIKDLSRDALTDRVLRAKPGFLAEPLREIAMYESVLSTVTLGTAKLYGTLVEPERGRYWIALEKVAGRELYQVGEIGVWQQVLRWLANMHDSFLRKKLPATVLRYDREFFGTWLTRARRISALEGLDRYDEAIARLASLPPTLLHGEFYASNLLVADDRVCAVDWEMAASGPGVIDVAAITMGWEEENRNLLTETYRTELAKPPSREEFARDLDFARLHLALQWLGWSAEWSPPPEHAQDLRKDVLVLAERLGL